MAKNPLITVVTPSYNQAPFLEQTILSVLNQDYPHVEYLVIDGQSTDNSVDIIKQHESGISYWCSEPDKGQSDAIAKGFQRSSGEIMCWLASDDFLLPGALTAVAEYFKRHPKIETVSGGCYFVDVQGRSLKRYGQYTLGVKATYNRFRYYEQDGVAQQATFWRRHAYDAVGGLDPTLEFIMDLDLFTRLAKRKQFGRLPRLLAGFRVHEGAKSSNIQHIRKREQQKLFGCHRWDSVSKGFHRIMYWRYRIPSLMRKVFLIVLQALRIVKLPKFFDANAKDSSYHS